VRTGDFKGALLPALVLISITALAITLLPTNRASATPDSLVPHDPIYIDGNDNFTPANGVNGGGSGTKNNPYIIENWAIGASEVGIKIWNTTAYFVVRNCVVENCGSGILFCNVQNGRVENNKFENHGYGIDHYKSHNNIISGNTVINTYHGIAPLESDNNLITGNTVGNNYYGIWLENSFSDNNLISGNTVENNNRGIWLQYSNNNVITGNTVGNNYYGIRLYYNTDNNLICHNNLINNTDHAYDEGSNYWDDGYPSGGNYWSDYTGEDENHGENQNIPGSDGIGDTPYYIPGDNNRDRYPLMNPWGVAAKVKIAVICAEPSDVEHRHRHDRAYYEEIAKNLEKYFDEASYGALEIEKVDIYDNAGNWYKLDFTSEYYKTEWKYAGTVYVSYNDRFIKHSLQKADVDIPRLYNINIVVGSDDFEEPVFAYWWPGSVRINEGEVKNLILVLESLLINTWAHEIGHALGQFLRGEATPDLYPIDRWWWPWDFVGDIDSWGLMGMGRWPVHPCSWTKEYLGWLKYRDFSSTLEWVRSLPNLRYGDEVLRRWTDGWIDDEYFIFEVRSPDRLYSEWDYNVPISPEHAGGLVVYKHHDPWIGDSTLNVVKNTKTGRSYFLPGESCWIKPPIKDWRPDEPGVFLEVLESRALEDGYEMKISVQERWCWENRITARLCPFPQWWSSSPILPSLPAGPHWPDLDLHVYTLDGKHVGTNYETGEYEMQIPDSIASGDFYNSSEWIYVPENVDVYFVVSSRDVAAFLEDRGALDNENGFYSLTLWYFDENMICSGSDVENQIIRPGVEALHPFEIVRNPDGTYDVTVHEGHAIARTELPPTDDSHVDQWHYPDRNYGSEESLLLRSRMASGESRNQRIFMKFDLGGIPSGMTITKAKLWLYSYRANWDDMEVQACAVDDDTWGEDTITWNNQPAHGTAIGSTTLHSKQEGWYSLDITSFVQGEYEGDKVASLCLRALHEDLKARYMFRSKEYGVADLRPYLEVYWAPSWPPAGAPATISLSGVGGIGFADGIPTYSGIENIYIMQHKTNSYDNTENLSGHENLQVWEGNTAVIEDTGLPPENIPPKNAFDIVVAVKGAKENMAYVVKENMYVRLVISEAFSDDENTLASGKRYVFAESAGNWIRVNHIFDNDGNGYKLGAGEHIDLTVYYYCYK